MQAEVFPSRRGKFHTVLILAAVLLVVAGFVQLVWAPEVGTLAKVGWGLLLAAAAGGLLWALAWTRYRVTADSLVLRCGPFRCTLALADIGELARVRSAASSYALTRQRLRIVLTGAKGCFDISPHDEDGFLRAIAARRTDLVATAEGLAPARSAAAES